jgi:hypothetical protein
MTAVVAVAAAVYWCFGLQRGKGLAFAAVVVAVVGVVAAAGMR